MKKIFLIVGVLILLFLGWYFIINTKSINTPSSQVQTTEIPKPVKKIKKTDPVVTPEPAVQKIKNKSPQQNIQKNTSDSEEKEPFERIQVKDDRVEFYDENKKLINQIILRKHIDGEFWSRNSISKNKKFFVLNKIEFRDVKWNPPGTPILFEYNEEKSIKSIEVYNQSGDLVWIAKPSVFINGIEISNNGKIIFAYSDGGEIEGRPLTVFFKNGLIKKIDLESANFNYSFSPSGKYIITMKGGINIEDQIRGYYVSVYKDDGKIIHEQLVEAPLKKNFCSDTISINENNKSLQINISLCHQPIDPIYLEI